MVKIEDLYNVYLIARKNKRRKNDAVLFEMNYERGLYELCDSINNRTYRASDNYTFVVTAPRPREVFAAELKLRIIHTYLNYKLGSIIESELTDRTFNNRLGYGTDRAINQVISDIYEVSEGFSREAWIIKWDITGYFPNALCDVVYNQFVNLVQKRYNGDDKEDILWMLLICVYSDPARHCYRKSPISAWDDIEPSKSLFNKPFSVGGAIGFLLWQIAMNYYLNDIDHWAVDEMRLKYTRYVDDSTVITENKDFVLSLLPIIRGKYEEIGAEMHKKKFYCQHISKGLEYLGSHIKMERVYLNNRIIKHAENRIDVMNSWSESRRYHNIEYFISVVNCYLGMLKRRNNYAISRNLIDRIDSGWMKFVHFDLEKMKSVANEGYTHNELLARNYNLKLKGHGITVL